MKTLKCLMLSILMSTILTMQLPAQITETKESTCTEGVPALEIYSIEENIISLNRSDFEIFDSIQIYSFDDGGIPKVWGVSPTVGNDIDDTHKIISINDESENQDFYFENCKNYDFKVVAYCNSKISYSGVTSYLYGKDDCKASSLRKKRFNEQELKISPQPANSSFNIENFSGTPITSINIFTVQGEKILTMQNEMLNKDVKIDISDLNIGVYIISIEQNNKSISYQKLIVGN